MPRGWQGFATGALGLALLYLLVANRTANANAAGITSGAGRLARKFLSPAVPAFGPAPSSSGTGVQGTAGQGAVAGGQAAMGQLGGFGVQGTAGNGVIAGANAAINQLGGTR